ncbi:disease resistance protein At4g27190 [Medicago truncatula]|uniref:disease resistance protein At4g27190 n=1 Tax=Medicago truncatula TaxID=3880 RepID=UPI0019680354|nr:disease resistance protein At4g27190 [Medicago truncatula]
MKNEKAKRLFLLCSVFQEDENIPIEMVTRLGIGAGLFGEDYGSYEDGRIQAVYTKEKLLDSCLLLEANHNKVKMPYFGRDAAQRIADNKIQTVKLDGKNQKKIDEKEKNIKYLFCEGKIMDVFSYNFDGSKLEILIVTVYKDEDCRDVKNEVPNSFFENNNDLRVFHLLYDHYRRLSLSLPRSIESLKNIRSLLFTLVDLGNISTLANLQSLETLDLKDCKIDELPHGIAELEKFRLLNLECCIIERNDPFEVIERCSLLEELYFTGSFNASCREITFPKLQRFCIDEHRRSVNDSSSKYVSVLEKDEVFLSETTLRYCLQEAEVLRLRSFEREWRNLIPEIVSMDQGMNYTVELSLSCISQLQHLIDTNGIGFQVPNVFFSNLVVLKLDGMENLEELFNGPVSSESLMYLEKVSIKDCKHLKSLFKCQRNLYNLKIIKLQNCPMLVSVFQPLTSQSLVSLEKLKIANCEGLENIVTYEKREKESRVEIDVDNDKKSGGSIFSKLKVIAIEECPRLEYIFPFLSAQRHPVLETIRIRRCDKLKYIIGQDQYNISYRLLIWEYVPCLPIQSYSLCNVKEINLSHFLAIKSVFILSITPRMLLETLTIKNCDELKNIIIDINHDSGGHSWGKVFPKLKRIYVEDCIKFEYIIGYYDGENQSHNEIHLHLPALKYISLCNLPGLVAMCTKQYRTTFPPLVELEHNRCSHAAIKSFHGFIIHPSLESMDTIKKEDGDDQITKSSFSIATVETNDQGEPSQSQIDEYFSSSLAVTKELENLVSKNHLAIENLSLLTDFLVKHPSVHLKDPSLSNRYKGYAYNCLAELLKFLQPHNVLDVVGSSHSEFVELLQDVRRFPFDKEWLDGVEKVVGLKTHID